MSDSLRPPWTAAHQAFLSFTISLSLLKLMSFDSVMPSNHLVLCHPLLLLPSIFPSIRVFSNDELALCIRWPNYWSFSFSISPSNEYLELISFRIDWFDLLAVQGTLKSLLQHPSSKASIPWHSVLFMDHIWITEEARKFQKNIYFCFIDYAKAFDCEDHNKLWKILKEMGIPDHLTCFLNCWLLYPVD